MSAIATTPYLNLRRRSLEEVMEEQERARDARWALPMIEFARDDLRKAERYMAMAERELRGDDARDIADIRKGIADLLSDVEGIRRRLQG